MVEGREPEGRNLDLARFGLAQHQRALLEREGIVFDNRGEASWERFGWDPYE